MSERAARRELLGTAAVVLGLVGVVAAKGVLRALEKSPTEQQCEALVERYLEHAAREQSPQLSRAALDGAIQQTRARPERLVDARACLDRLTARAVDCGLRAGDLEALERCIQ
jgi:hypothetical protein